MRNARKITGKKFNITLPKEWRESLSLEPGMSLTPIFESGSPLILIPEDAEMPPVVGQMVELITKWGAMTDANEARNALKIILMKLQ